MPSLTPSKHPKVTHVEPVLLTNSEADVWNPGGAATDIYEVTLTLVNTDSSDRTVTLGWESNSTGGLAVIGQWVPGTTVVANRTLVSGPFRMAGDDAIRGSASVTSVVNVQIIAELIAS